MPAFLRQQLLSTPCILQLHFGNIYRPKPDLYMWTILLFASMTFIILIGVHLTASVRECQNAYFQCLLKATNALVCTALFRLAACSKPSFSSIFRIFPFRSYDATKTTTKHRHCLHIFCRPLFLSRAFFVLKKLVSPHHSFLFTELFPFF